MKEKFDVTGMTCSACSSHVEKAVRGVPGVFSVSVNLLQNNMAVDYDPAVANSAAVVQAVEKAGYGASPQQSEKAAGSAAQAAAKGEQSPAAKEAANMKRRLITSIVLLVPLMYISMGSMMGLPLPGFLDGYENVITYGMAQLLLTLAIAYINRKYFVNGFRSLAHRAPTMDALIAIGSSAAILYGIYAIIRMGNGLALGDTALVHQYHMDLYFESAGTILTLITVGKYLESRSKGRTSDAITRLMDLSPKTALLLRDGKEVEVPVEQVAVGDLLAVKPGSAIPVDGVVTEGFAAIDESAITGESIPVEKVAGDAVTGATVNRTGYLTIRATRVGADTTLAQIVQLVEEASASKAPIARLADKVSGVFVPVVITIAVLATVVWLLLGQPVSFALSIGIAVLVISCPCALGLATPTAIMVGTGKAAEHGILFKNAESIETAHTVQTVILDKTGTVTEGKPAVTGLYPAAGVAVQELLALAASAETRSEHPLGAAILARAEQDGVQTRPVSSFEQLPGQGVRVTLDEKTVLAGNRRMMDEAGVDVSMLDAEAEAAALNGETPLYFALDGVLQGLVSVADTIKPTSRQAVAELQAMGVEVVLLTGDNQRTAEAVARQLSVDKVIAGVLPQGKEEEVRRQQANGRKVAMVGDGVNDAPALARADVGIAIGAGTDIAMESADVVLMKSDLMDVVTTLQLSRATIRNIKQNLFWAFFYNALGIPLAAGLFIPLTGWKLNPMFASAAMSLSSLFVVTNALRLRFFKPRFHTPPTVPVGPVQTIQTGNQTNKGETTMTKTVKIEGMMCGHCQAHVEKALNALPGATAQVDLEGGTATVTSASPISDDAIKQAVTDAGYTPVSVQ